MRKRHFINGTDYLITAVLIAVLFLSACWIRNIYPFGTNLITNASDFQTQSVPIYMHLWDALHGEASLFFDWRFGLGSSVSGTLSHYSLVSPLSLFFLFVSRESIPYTVIWFLLMRITAMGLTMCCFLRNDRLFFEKQPKRVWIIAGSVGYALSGYTAQYYGFPWIDTAIMVPLLFLFLNQMLRHESRTVGKTEIGYSVVLALIAIINIPQAFAVCLIVMGYACGALFLKQTDSSLRRNASEKLIICSVLGIGMSMIIFLPAYLNISHSYRMSFGNYGKGLASYIAKMDLQKQETYRKYLIVLGSAVPLFGGLLSWKNTKRKDRIFCLYLLFLSLTPVIFESVNGIYHNGPYSCYPMRYGFLTVFLMIAAGLSMMENTQWLHKPAVSLVLLILWGALGEGLFLRQIEGVSPYGYEDLHTAVQESERRSDSLIYDRYRQADAAMMENYPLYADLPAISNYVPLNSLRQVNFFRALGYAQNWVALDDAGGTVFTDMMLGIRKVLISNSYEDEFAKRTKGSGMFRAPVSLGDGTTSFEYAMGYDTPLFTSTAESAGTLLEGADNPFEAMNRLSNLFWNSEIFTAEATEAETDTVTYTHVFSDTSMLYLWLPEGMHEIIVNDQTVKVPLFTDSSNVLYPRDTNNGLLLLGTFENESTEVIIHNTAPGETAVFGWINIADLQNTAKGSPVSAVQTEIGNDSLKMTLTAGKDGYIFLPVYADEGWTYISEGTKIDPDKLCGTFPLFPVHEGENTIEMRYQPEGLTAGLIITIISVVLLIGYAALQKHAKQPAAVYAEWTVKAVWIVYLLYVYIIPILFRIGMSLYKRLL